MAAELFNSMCFNVNLKVFVRFFVGYEFVSREVVGKIDGAQSVGNVVDMLAFFGRRTVQDGSHHVPSDGFWVEGVIVPNDDAALVFQEFESGVGVFLYAFVMVVTVNEDHTILAEMGREIKGL